MQVSIVKQTHHEKGYQIMVQKGDCFYHVFPGALFTLGEAKALCEKNNFTVAAIGDIWQCANK
jgi:hypothetical protein